MSIRKIEKKIAKISAKLHDDAYSKCVEHQTEDIFIKPFLEAFGWDTTNITKVQSQAHVASGKIPDYALLCDGEIKTVIEVKRIGEGLAKHIPQLKEYVELAKPHIGILTNGQQWWFFSWHRRKKEMNEKPFAVIDITDLRLRKEDSFLQYFRQDKFSADFFKSFSHADYLSGQAHGTALGLNIDKKVERLIKKMFFLSCKYYEEPTIPGGEEVTRGSSWTRKQVKYLWEYTHYHSRWAFKNYKTRVKPMRK